MKPKSFEEAIVEKIREHMNNYADGLSTGSAQNFPDYRFQVGVIQGLAMAEREILDLIETARKLEDS
tara:strand:+ start:11015 stop:11215 length:201 start_codon:yes stop_codon:yes gene_type:complete